jgi:mRNA interferase HigB
MKIMKTSTLKAYYEKHPETETGLKVWVKQVKEATWEKPDDILNTFSHARPIGNGRVIFKINKNDYRLIVKVEYRLGIVFVCFVGTHEEYDKEDALTVHRY